MNTRTERQSRMIRGAFILQVPRISEIDSEVEIDKHEPHNWFHKSLLENQRWQGEELLHIFVSS